MNIYTSISQLVGNTPLLQLCNYEKSHQLSAQLFAKLEFVNPSGSVKARAALTMILKAEETGALIPGATIIEPTSGNTGIGLAAIAATRGYQTILTMPETMSRERQMLLKAYGATLVLTPGAKGMQGAVDRALELAAEIPGSFVPSQFENHDNALAHYETTGPEIWRDTDGTVDIFVAGVGTGGTITGTGRYLKEQNPGIHVIAVEPMKSPLLTGGLAGPHNLQGIGANFIPGVLDQGIYDQVMDVLEEDAYEAARQLTGDGVLCGISGGAILWAATQIAKAPENVGKRIVLMLPDSGERYLSTALFAQE